jgi:hypothetical protein
MTNGVISLPRWLGRLRMPVAMVDEFGDKFGAWPPG